MMKLCALAAVLLIQTFDLADGHGSLVFPPSRNAVDRFLPSFAGGAWPAGSTGCNCGTNKGCVDGEGIRATANGQPCLWFSQGCTIGCEQCDNKTQHTMGKSLCNSTKAPTLPKHAWTMNRWAEEGSVNDTYRQHPWRSPGSAPAYPCGMAGGAPTRGGGDAVFATTPFAKQGDMGADVLQPAPTGVQWKAGETVEVSWAIRFNHGGGYSYRLCPADQPLTEACFQKHPLPFALTNQTLQFSNGTRETIASVFVSEGTTPAGSIWAMNPIPRIDFDSKSSGQPAGWTGCDWPAKGLACRQFDPPCKEDHGWAAVPGESAGSVDVEGRCSGDATEVAIVDEVVIPKDLPTGNYVLGWRWDCEETAQVWTNCADVFIRA